MRPTTCARLLLAAVALGSAAPTAATTIRPPRNLGQLARLSRAVVLARAGDATVEDRGLPYTVTTFELVEPVGGARMRAVFTVESPGGALPHRAAVVSGSPRFVDGRVYMLFLDRAGHGRWRPRMLAYGLLEEVQPKDGEALMLPLDAASDIELRDGGVAHERVTVYRERALVHHLREVLAGAQWDRRKVEPRSTDVALAELIAKPANCQFQLDPGDQLPMRRFGYETGGTMSVDATTPGQTGIADGGVSAVQQGVAAWTNHPDSVIRYLFGTTRPRNIACSAASDLDEGGVVFNDPCNDIADLAGCTGTLAFGGSFYDPSSTTLYDGEPWHAVQTAFVVVNNGSQCVGETGFKEMLTHELGHTQGFGHHTDPDATMAAVLKNDGRGAALHATDKGCASYAYHTFLDVPYSHPMWAPIEAIENAGITTGCGAARYCPAAIVKRDQMAILLERGIHGGGFAPPPATGIFADVATNTPAAPFIEQLVRDAITSGCAVSPLRYCPGKSVTRSQMAIFLLRAKHGGTYVPPPATGTVFVDVPASNPAAPWIEQLAAEGITSGCTATRFCPEQVVSNDQMAVFLVRTFSLPVPTKIP